MDVSSIPIDKLAGELPKFTNRDDWQAAVQRLRAHADAKFGTEADGWREKQRPANMKRAHAFQIREFNGAAACGAISLTHPRIPGHRNVMPGEVFAADLEWPKIRAHIAAKHIELTTAPLTRPIVYPSKYDAQFTTPHVVEAMAGREPATLSAVDARARALVAELQAELDATNAAADTTGDDEDVALEVEKQRVEREVSSGAPKPAARRRGRSG